MIGFEWHENFLFSDDVSIQNINAQLNEQESVHQSVFVYSKGKILENIRAYKVALQKLNVQSYLGFSIKANYNLSILRVFRENGCLAIAVSGNEVLLADKAGFSSDRYCKIYKFCHILQV